MEEESNDEYHADHSAAVRTVSCRPSLLCMGKLRRVEAVPSKVKREVSGS
jgi:hypothetical protein